MSTPSTNTSGDITIGGDATAANLIGRDQINLHIQNVVLQIAETLPTDQDTPTAEWQACAQRYRDGIYHTCNRIRLLGRQETKPLDAMYTDVYLLPERIARRRYAIDLNEHFKRDFAEYDSDSESQRLPAHSLLSQPASQRLFILGKPGAGKTTFLRHVAMQAARGELDKLPIFITLRDWSDSKSNLLDYIIQQFDIHGFPRARAFVSAMLGLGRALVLFDGLDEVNLQNKKRETVIREIKHFCQQYRPTQCLLTCRNAAEDYTFEGFSYVEVADFTDAQVNTFASHWFAPNQADTEAFLTALAHKDHKGIRDLCKTPLLLTLVCLTFEETRTFPPRRAELYQQALDGLLVKWDNSRRIKRDDLYGRLSLGRKTQLLARLAHDAFQRHEIFFKLPWLARQTEQQLASLPPSELGVSEIDGTGVIKMIEAQHGLLVERAHEVYSFSHLTLQEYFTAQYLHSHQDKLASLFTPERILDDRWREVFLLTASLWDEADGFFAAFAAALQTMANEWRKHSTLQSIAKHALNQTKKNNNRQLRQLLLFYITIHLIDNWPLIHALTHARELTQARANALKLALVRGLDLDLARILAHDLIHTHDYDLADALRLACAYALDLALIRAHDYDLAHALDLAHTLVHTLDTKLGIVARLDWQLLISRQIIALLAFIDGSRLNLPRTWLRNYSRWHQSLIDTAQRAQQPTLARALQQLNLPQAIGDRPQWQVLSEAFTDLMRTQRDWPIDLEWTKEAIDTLDRYFRANQLYLDCLAVASVSDREKFKNLAIPLPNLQPAS